MPLIELQLLLGKVVLVEYQKDKVLLRNDKKDIFMWFKVNIPSINYLLLKKSTAGAACLVLQNYWINDLFWFFNKSVKKLVGSIM